METPVLYFYTNHETTVSVHVSFSKGLITEWYPHADRVEPVGAAASKPSYFNDQLLYDAKANGSISWDSVKIEPRGSEDFPRDAGSNHYYAARATSATPLRVFSRGSEQTEKFLFYRGVSTMSVPLSVRQQSDGKLRGESLGSEQIPAVLLFERRGERIGFRVSLPSATEFVLDAPELNGDMNSLRQAVVDLLVGQGLYLDEAQAMFDTWQDSWFEEGSRLLYIVPREFVDSVLPLSIRPVPSQTVRVFVGRLELITPATQSAVEQALATRDRVTLTRYGRFLMPILNVILSEEGHLTPEQIDAYCAIASTVQQPQTSNALR